MTMRVSDTLYTTPSAVWELSAPADVACLLFADFLAVVFEDTFSSIRARSPGLSET